MRRSAWAGRIPLSVYATSLRKSYADALVRNALDAYIILNGNPEIDLMETAAATDALFDELGPSQRSTNDDPARRSNE